MSSPDDSSGPPREPVSACPRCGSSSAHPFSTVGVCLRCAGERVLAFADTPEPPLATPELGTLRRTSVNLPARIGPYEIIEELGRGGMGYVYAARQTGLGRVVALKVLPEGEGGVAGLELRFLREAQTVARMRHPNIVAIHDSGRADGYVYFSMDYVDGGDLAQRLRADALPPAEAARIAEKIASALAATHAEGVLHRDIKPSNILLDGDEPKLADFGLAAQLEPGGDLTLRSGVLGTPHYVAPEALRGGSAALSAASDLYALGVVLYQMLTGRTPFANAAPAELASLLERAEVPRPRVLAPAVPRDLETICLKCLAHDAERRYATAAELAADLRRFLAGEPIRARPPGFGERCAQFTRRHRAVVGSTLAIGAALVGATAFSTWQAVRARRAEHVAAAASERSRQLLRDARLAEARATRSTNLPGRRQAALKALAEAARIRPGDDVRDEAAAALLLQDVREEAVWDRHTDGPWLVVPSPDTTILAMAPLTGAGQVGELALYRWGVEEPYARLDLGGTARISGPRFSPDGRWLAVRCADGSLRIFAAADGKLARVLADHPLPDPQSLGELSNRDYDFSTDSRRVVLSRPDGGFAVYGASDGAELARADSDVPLTTLAFSPDGRWLAGTNLGRTDVPARLWVYDARTFALARTIDLPALPDYFAWSASGRLLAVATVDHLLSQYDPARGTLERRFPRPMADASEFAYVAEDRLIASRGAGTQLHFFDAALGTHEFQLDRLAPVPLLSPARGAPYVVVNESARLARLRFDRPAGHRLVTTPDGDGSELGAENLPFALSADERWIATGNGREVVIRDFADGRLLGRWRVREAAPREFTGVALSLDNAWLYRGSSARGLFAHRLTSSADGTVTIGDPVTLDAAKGYLLLDASADRRRFLQWSADTDELRVLAIDRPDGPARVVSHWSAPHAYSGAFSPDATQVLLNFDPFPPDAEKRRIGVYRTDSGERVRQLDAPVGAEARWSTDGRTAMTSNGMDLSIVWDTATWTRRAELHGVIGGQVTTFGISPDGSYAAVTRDDRFHLIRVRDGRELLNLQLPHSSSLAMGLKWLPDGKRVVVRWWDGRIDVIEPFAIETELRRWERAGPTTR